MGKATKELSGKSKEKYFRELLRAHGGIEAEACKRLERVLQDEVRHIRVRWPVPERGKALVQRAAGSVIAPAPVAAVAVDSFDPNAWSLIVVLRKEGPAGLLSKLAAVDGIEHLHAIAKAQHVAIDPALADRAAIHAAILTGTERRIASRQAAAS